MVVVPQSGQLSVWRRYSVTTARTGGHRGDLMPRWLLVPAQQQVPALPARRRRGVHDLIHLLSWHERSARAPMPALPTPLAYRLRAFAMHRHAWGV